MSTTYSHETDVMSPNRFGTEPTPLRKLTNDLGMRAVGRLGVGLNAIFGGRAERPLGILTYHRVAKHVSGFPAPLHNVSPKRFREQLTGLIQRGFRFWPLRKALEAHRDGNAIPPHTLLVTFDDGFASVYTNAWPVLRELEIPATIFVNTAYLNDEHPFPFDAWGMAYSQLAPPGSWRPLTWRECHEMSNDSLIEIGAHTHTHEDMRGRPEDFQDDLQISVDIVRREFGAHNVPFAFPFGSRYLGFSGDELVEAAKETGVTCGLTTECVLVDPTHDPFNWGRFNAFAWDTSATLAAKLSGWYGWAPAMRKRVASALGCR